MYDQRFGEAEQRCTSVLESLPEVQREKLLALLEETRERHSEIKDLIRRSRDALDDWRLLEKYILFDLEARLRGE